MKRTLLLATLLLVVAAGCARDTTRPGYVNGPLLFEADFSSPEALAKWRNAAAATWLEKGGPDGGPTLRFNANMISLPLDATKLHGLLRLEAVVKGENLELAAKPYWGPKVMLSFNDGRRMRYDEPQRQLGSYPWKKVSMITLAPEGSRDMTLSLGIQNGVGAFYVSSVKIFQAVEGEVVDAPPPVNEAALAIPRGDGHGTKFRGVMSGRGLGEQDFATLKDWHVNLMRYQLNPGITKSDISTSEQYLAWIDAAIVKLDAVLPIARRNGVKIAIDLHTGPGTKISKVASNILVNGDLRLDTLVEAWRKLASHYKGNPDIYGYDLLNEPVVDGYVKGKDNPWQLIAERLVKEIRAIDPDTPIIVEPDATMDNLKPIDAKNIIYSPHFYSPHAFTHQGVLNQLKWVYPGEIDGVYWDKEQLRVALKPAIDFQRKHHVPLFIGEFSVAVWAKGGDQYLADCVALFEEYGWDWTYHAYREWPGWSLEHEGDSPAHLKPSADNPRKQVMLEAFKKNSR